MCAHAPLWLHAHIHIPFYTYALDAPATRNRCYLKNCLRMLMHTRIHAVADITST